MISGEVILGIMIPFAATAAGSAVVLLTRREMRTTLQKALLGFAAGVMVAATVWSLLIPSMELSEDMGNLRFVPALAGFVPGAALLLALDVLVPHQHVDSDASEGRHHERIARSRKLTLAVTLHNIPEGVAVGAVFAGVIFDVPGASLGGALSLALGISIQNIPEGAIISMPLRSIGIGKWKSFCIGALSGAVEPIAAVVCILAVSTVVPMMEYMLGFAAGAMLFVVIDELLPGAHSGDHSNWATVSFLIGFVMMMVLDVAFSRMLSLSFPSNNKRDWYPHRRINAC